MLTDQTRTAWPEWSLCSSIQTRHEARPGGNIFLADALSHRSACTEPDRLAGIGVPTLLITGSETTPDRRV